MLLTDFFDIQSITSDSVEGSLRSFNVLVLLNASHPIYLGHFPGNPVVPGVCQIQMVRELVEKAIGHPLKLTESDNIKFLSMINPDLNPLLECNIIIKTGNDQQLTATATVGSGETFFLKFRGKFEFAV